jgi:hypothetical protein
MPLKITFYKAWRIQSAATICYATSLPKFTNHDDGKLNAAILRHHLPRLAGVLLVSQA